MTDNRNLNEVVNEVVNEELRNLNEVIPNIVKVNKDYENIRKLNEVSDSTFNAYVEDIKE